jgi:hypothetical protein
MRSFKLLHVLARSLQLTVNPLKRCDGVDKIRSQRERACEAPPSSVLVVRDRPMEVNQPRSLAGDALSASKRGQS